MKLSGSGEVDSEADIRFLQLTRWIESVDGGIGIQTEAVRKCQTIYKSWMFLINIYLVAPGDRSRHMMTACRKTKETSRSLGNRNRKGSRSYKWKQTKNCKNKKQVGDVSFRTTISLTMHICFYRARNFFLSFLWWKIYINPASFLLVSWQRKEGVESRINPSRKEDYRIVKGGPVVMDLHAIETIDGGSLVALHCSTKYIKTKPILSFTKGR